jgi:putative transposase
MLDNAILKDVAAKKWVTPAAKREAVVHAYAVHGVSQRRACEALRVDRSSVRYRSARPDDGELRDAIKAVASERRRFGYRRIHVMLQCQGIVMNLKKLWRVYGKERHYRSASAVAASVPWAREDPCWCRTNPTSAGAWTSSAMPSPIAARFGVLTVLDDHTRGAWR